MEINIVYPAIAAGWVIFAASEVHFPTADGSSSGSSDGHPKIFAAERRIYLLSVIPMAVISVAYFAFHLIVAPLPATGAYALHFDGSLLKTFALYWKWSLAPEPMTRFGHSDFAVNLVLLIGTLAIASFVVAELARRRFAVLFFLVWGGATLAPVLPLPDHRCDYYLTIPVIGIAMLGGAAAARYGDASWMKRALMATTITAYLWAMVPVTRAATHWWLGQSISVRTLVLGVTAARETHPGKAIAIDGVTTELLDLSYWPFLAMGIPDVYLTPESGLAVKRDPLAADDHGLVLDADVLKHGIVHNDVVVYRLATDHLRNTTQEYAQHLTGREVDRLPSHIDVGNSIYSWLLGPTWLPPESGIRWMPGKASLRLGVPEIGGNRLELDGYCPKAQLLLGPRHLLVLVDGVVAGETRIYDPETNFRRTFPMPTVGKINAAPPCNGVCCANFGNVTTAACGIQIIPKWERALVAAKTSPGIRVSVL